MGSNALCFGGGGLVGTSEALGHVVGLDQVIRAPEDREVLKPSFFDYMARAGVTLKQLDTRIDDVLAVMPEDVRSGRRDFLPHYFDVLSGISGGSLLATALASGMSIVELVREAVDFPVLRAYFRPDVREYLRCLARLPAIPLKAAIKSFRLLDLRPGRLLARPTLRLKQLSRVVFELVAAFEDMLPRGLFTGEGLERYVQELSRRRGLATTFEEVRDRGKRLYVISDRFNYSATLSEGDGEASTAVYLGLAPHDRLPIARAIRASCSIPLITTPLELDDPELGREVLMVDGALGKTLGRRTLFEVEPLDLMVTVNPIIPYDGKLETMIDIAEQFYRKLIYSRLKAVEAYAGDENQERTINIESRPDEFFYNMFRIDKMKEGLFEGYYQTLKVCAENYIEMNRKLARGGLTLIPRSEIFELLMGNDLLRERAYVRRETELERGDAGFFRRIDRALAAVLRDGVLAEQDEVEAPPPGPLEDVP